MTEPENVRELVTIITEAIEDPGKVKRENRLDMLRSRTVADVIARMQPPETLELERRIQSTIEDSSRQDRDAATTMQTDHLSITFMVNPHSTKVNQRIKVEAEANRLKALRGSRKTSIAVFSMRLIQDGIDFETALIPD